MPTYEYRCKECGQDLDVVQSFTDDPLTTCEACGGQLRKLFGNVGIAFKGSGFYKTDSRGKAPSSGDGDKAGSDKGGSDKSRGSTSDAGSGKEGSGTKEAAKPAPSSTANGAAATPSKST